MVPVAVRRVNCMVQAVLVENIKVDLGFSINTAKFCLPTVIILADLLSTQHSIYQCFLSQNVSNLLKFSATKMCPIHNCNISIISSHWLHTRQFVHVFLHYLLKHLQYIISPIIYIIKFLINIPLYFVIGKWKLNGPEQDHSVDIYQFS